GGRLGDRGVERLRKTATVGGFGGALEAVVMLVNALCDMALKGFERHGAVAVVFRLRVRPVAGIATGHGRMLGDFLGKITPGAFDRLRLAGARLDEMWLDIE